MLADPVDDYAKVSKKKHPLKVLLCYTNCIIGYDMCVKFVQTPLNTAEIANQERVGINAGPAQASGAGAWTVCNRAANNRFHGRIDSKRFGMANQKPTGFDSAMLTSSGRFKRARRQAVFKVV